MCSRVFQQSVRGVWILAERERAHTLLTAGQQHPVTVVQPPNRYKRLSYKCIGELSSIAAGVIIAITRYTRFHRE